MLNLFLGAGALWTYDALPTFEKACCLYLHVKINRVTNQWRTQEFCSGGGVQQIQLRTEGRENVDRGAVAPRQGFRSICK
jgi:hypothetical protein